MHVRYKNQILVLSNQKARNKCSASLWSRQSHDAGLKEKKCLYYSYELTKHGKTIQSLLKYVVLIVLVWTKQHNKSIFFILFQSSTGEKKEYLFKVLVIGDLGVGKTSIIKRYVHQFFSVHYRATVSFTVIIIIMCRYWCWRCRYQEKWACNFSNFIINMFKKLFDPYFDTCKL
mgnify:CR=1 FL=1